MDAGELVQVGRDMLLTALLLSAPAVAVSLIVGLAISVFQALTSIQEQTLNFAPRIVAVSVVLIVTLPWSLKLLTSFTVKMFIIAAKAGPA